MGHMKMYTGDMEKLVVHQRLVHHLHTIVYNAQAHNAAKIRKMFSVMHRHVFRRKTTRVVHHRVVRSYSFKSTHTTKRTVRHMVKTMGTKKTIHVLKKVLRKAHSK